MALVLASSSPRRRELLAMVGAVFEVAVPDVDESTLKEGEAPEQLVVRLAEAKAADVSRRRPEDVVVGADTVVVLDGRVTLGKPADRADARRMLKLLSGRTHQVWTGLAVVHRASRRSVTAAERTDVTFRQLSDEEIQRYVERGEGLDKAGAYAVQGVGALFVERLEGCYYNVVGLPLSRLECLLKGFGVRLW